MIPDYEAMLEEVYRAILRPGDCAVDVGAHRGRHTLPMADAVGVHGKVLAFEPLPTAYALLANASRAVDSITTYNIALSDEDGEADFVYVPDFPEFSGFLERTYHDETIRREKIQVPMRKLDSFLDIISGVRYIKLDIEGGELKVLRGATRMIEQYAPVVSFELGESAIKNYPYSSADYFAFFSGRGYVLHSIFGEVLTALTFAQAAGAEKYWDYIALPQGWQWPL